MHLRSVAYRMLGSLSEADDAVQEAWLRLSRADTGDVRDLRAWLTTVVSRVCLDMLRSRASRREDSLDVHVPDPIVTRVDDDPAEHALLADSVGIALLVVLDTLSPAERLAFVLHDVFAVPFEQIGPILDRSPGAAKQLASRARQRLRAAPARPARTPPTRSPRRALGRSARRSHPAVDGRQRLPRRVARGRLRGAARHPRPGRRAAGRRRRGPARPVGASPRCPRGDRARSALRPTWPLRPPGPRQRRPRLPRDAQRRAARPDGHHGPGRQDHRNGRPRRPRPPRASWMSSG